MDEITRQLTAMTSGLMQAGRQWRRLAQDALAAHDISEAQAAPLLWVCRLGGGVRQVQLAAHVGIEGTSLVRLLDQLGAAGLIVRKDDPDDRRAKTIWLTEPGEELAQRIEQILRDIRAQVFARIAAADVEATLRVFQAIDAAAAGPAASGSSEP